VIIGAALGGFTYLGYHATEKWAEGLKSARLGDFADVAEQIRQDVKSKLDNFIRDEERRRYTEYQYYLADDNFAPGQQEVTVFTSPLSGRLEHGLGYNHFQVNADGRVLTPNDYLIRNEEVGKQNTELYAQALHNFINVRENVAPLLTGATLDSSTYSFNINGQVGGLQPPRSEEVAQEASAKSKKEGLKSQDIEGSARQRQARESYPVLSLDNPEGQAQTFAQRRVILQANEATNAGVPLQNLSDMSSSAERQMEQAKERGELEERVTSQHAQESPQQWLYPDVQSVSQQDMDEIVQVRVDRFVPLIIPGGEGEKSIFDGQVFLVRRVQIDGRQFWQGFQLNESKLIEEVKESSNRLKREGMSFELVQAEREDEDIAYRATLDFGFGDLLLDFKDNPLLIGRQISGLRHWYFSIVAIVFLATMLGLVSLWRYARAQIKLAQKKDDFISAVSHELRTPLTSIRMYSEMLERDWVKSKDKLGEYYSSMRQESERLSRLIENVLDFSRIQRGRKKYAFRFGDLNECIEGVVEMMRPYAAQNGFSIRTQLEELSQTAFDSDAIKQIVVNLLDNAIKYARSSEDRTVTVRTKSDSQFVFIEVEDHGPGVPHRQRKKIFEEFYRTEAEATRETAGTGLGLALVKKFAQAHDGFVEILTAKPAGAIFRVGLAVQN
jgi:signal transduction histidine kinase